ncbi:hypothetical protein HW115_03600 [Verrucomicrobiaceae bacterium N1E253]|uniref:Uncharacterized protein n=1 Tax=Oceaniferula marina TaxID=2748318 RepID=A0A851GFW7_9BACT|nr:hypothetical protein [Oceaniferula marina]NWK54681.1 hypothetical protein [Oceaniferula marina]
MPHSPDSIQYAMETAQLLREPDRRIDTFGSTRFKFTMLSEPMDQVGQVRVRQGEVEAQKPQIIRPGHMGGNVELEGFQEKAGEYLDWLREHDLEPVFFQYGFMFKRGRVTEELVHDSLEAVRDRVMEEVRQTGDPMLAVMEGVDDAWEVSLLKFAIEMIGKSSDINAFDFKRKGLL